MKKALIFLSLAGSFFFSFYSLNAAEMVDDFVVIQLDDIEWDENLNEVQRRVIYGDPDTEGLYIMRVRFWPGGSSLPHYHTQDRFVTVIEGTWHAGTDASHDMENTTEIPPGGFMIHPAGAVHYDGSRGGPVVVEIRGMGPVVTEYVDIVP